jgi:Zn-dependent membrane protease YugP
VLRLSPDVYQGNNLAAAGVAAHEAGHALQDQQGYAFLALRSLMVPSVQIGSWIGPLVFMLGFFMAGAIGTSLAWLGVAMFAATAVFALVTLPVEFDASRRAKVLLVSNGLLTQPELRGVNGVLDAAALTYVAGAVQALSTLLYYVFLLGGRRDE